MLFMQPFQGVHQLYVLGIVFIMQKMHKNKACVVKVYNCLDMDMDMK